MNSAIPPAPPPAAPPTQAGAAPVLSVAAESTAAADSLAKLPPGTTLAATVVATEGKAMVQVMTADGSSLSLRLPPGQAVPPDGAQLALQFISQNGLPAFKLLSINGRPPNALPLQPGAFGALPNLPNAAALIGQGAGAAKPAMAQTGSAGAPVVTSPGLAAGPLGLTATIIRSMPPGAVTQMPQSAVPDMAVKLPQSLLGLPPGTQLTVRIAAIAPPAQGAVPAGQPIPTATAQNPAGAAPPPQGAVAGPVPPQQAGAAAMPPSPHPPQGAEPHAPQAPLPGLPGQAPAPSAQLQQSGTPQSMPATPAGQPPAPVVTMPAVVLSQAPGSAALVQSPVGTLSLNVSTPLAAGSTLRLDVIDRPIPPAPTPAAPARAEGLTSGGWPALDDSVDTLLSNDRQAAEQLMRMIPQSGPRLAAAMSLFAGAVRSGEVGKLVSEPVTKGLERAGRKDLAERLKKDFLELSDQASRPVGRGDWQAISLPFAHGSQIDPINLYVHRPGDDEEKGGKKGSEQRFILDVRMSVLGRIQLDGLVQKDTKRFDLIVRTAEPLPPLMCRDIAGIFAECGQMTGIKGQVTFQAGRPFVELPPATPTTTQIVV